MTGSRGGILAAVVAGVVLALATPTGRRRLLAWTVVGVLLGAVAFVLHPLGIAERTVATSSSSGRFSIWRVGLAACPQYCGPGSGWETFPVVYARTQPSVADAQVLVGKGMPARWILADSGKYVVSIDHRGQINQVTELAPGEYYGGSHILEDRPLMQVRCLEAGHVFSLSQELIRRSRDRLKRRERS